MIVFASLHCALLRRIRSEFHVDFAAISVISDDGGSLRHVVVTPYAESMERMTMERGPRTPCEFVLETGKALAASRLENLPSGVRCPLMQAEKLQGFLGLPLWAQDYPVGAIQAMTSTPREWTQADLDGLGAYAYVLQAMIDKSVLSQSAEPKVVHLS